MIDKQIGQMIHDLEALKENEACRIHRLCEVVDKVSGRYFREEEAKRILTGFPKLDDITGGWKAGI